jgi:apolipoprotein N-acyltransferase
LVVWGESSIGVDLSSTPVTMAELSNLSRRVGAGLLVNVDARSPRGGIYKSSNLIGPNGSLGSYPKTRLVPFGEYVPLRPLLGWVRACTAACLTGTVRYGRRIWWRVSTTDGSLCTSSFITH